MRRTLTIRGEVQYPEALHRDVDEFAGGADQFDDITMLCIEMKSSGMKKINLAPTLEQLMVYLEREAEK